MLKKRITLIVILALISTSTPFLYQYIIEPRVDGANVTLEINNMIYNGDESNEEATAFTIYLNMENDENNEVIVSPLKTDVYYRSGNNYRLIGEFSTSEDYTIPAKSNVASEILDTEPERVDENKKTHNINKNIKGILKVYKKSGFIDGANDAFVSLINDGKIDLKFKGNSQFGPISIPFDQESDIELNLEIWDRNMVIKDVFRFQGESGDLPSDETFVLHTNMKNPSGLPLLLDSFSLDFYNTTASAIDPLDAEDQVAWGLESRDVATAVDPDNSSEQVNEIFLNNYINYQLNPRETKDVFLGLNFSNPNNPAYEGNIAWFVSQLLDKQILDGITIKGPAEIIVGQRDKGFKVDMTEEEDYLEIDDIKLYQQNLNTPQTMFENFSIGGLRMDRMRINTKTKDMTIDIAANLTLRNPYRFEYTVSNFEALYKHKSGNEFAKSAQPSTATVGRATREFSESEQEWVIRSSNVGLPVNLTTTFNTDNEEGGGIFNVIEDLGGDPNLLNLTNPFWLKKGTEEYYNNPLNTMEYIISQNVNPFTLLDEVSLLAQINHYQPLQSSYFGNSDRDPETTYSQASSETDMPYIGGTTFPRASHNQHANIDEIVTSWDNYYQSDIRSPNMYQIIQDEQDDLDNGASGGDYFPEDNDNNLADASLAGAIYEYQAGRTGDPSNDDDGLIWRIYEDGPANDKWGHFYDWYDGSQGDRGYTMSMYLPDGNSAMFSQNFTLNGTHFADQGGYSDNIEKVTLSTSYRYLSENYPTDDAYLLFSWFNSGEYDYNQFGTSGSAFKGRNGWKLPTTDDGEWDHYSVDLTEAFKTRLDQYVANGYDSNYLKGEISVSGNPSAGNDLSVYFDDIVLNIEYKDYDVGDSNGTLTVEDFFSYLRSVDPEKGNLFYLFDEMSGDGNIDSDEFWKYMSGNSEDGPEEGMDFFKYMEFSNVSFSAITDLLQNNYRDLDIGEPANFLEVLTKTKYEIPDPQGYGLQDIVSTKYGPRVLKDDYWTIEDPYNASREIMETLYQNIFNDPRFSENELWYMLDNLGVEIPWIIMYLYTHGWTKDDVYDVLEAIGFAKEVKQDYTNGRDEGTLTTTVYIDMDVYGIDTIDTTEPLEFDMGDVIQDGVEELFDYLSASNGDTGRYLINNYGSTDDADSAYFTGSFDVWLIPVSWSCEVTPEAFQLEMIVKPQGNLIASPADPQNYPPGEYPDETFIEDYYQFSSPVGLSDSGTRQLGRTLRTNYKFSGQTFIQQGGDLVSLFQFLDTYWFGIEADSSIDYNSFTLFNRFNMSSVDFIDIITGYDPDAGTWDENGNGRADDWTAPDHYGAGNRDNLRGWGTSFRDNRLYWGPNDDESLGQQDGKIIWTDSPDFAETSSEHQSGFIEDDDKINQGAPPVVNLLDMLYWISEASGKPDPDELVRWLMGSLSDDFYDVVNPFGGALGDSQIKHKGLTNQKVWRMFRTASLNATGFFDWMENEKSISSFKFLMELNKTTQMVNPLDLLFFATSPNMIRFYDDALALMYHDALDSQGTDDPNDLLWNFFDTELFDEEEFFTLLNETGFHIFETFINLKVDPASWLQILNQDYNLEPIEVIKRMKKVEPGADYIELDEINGKTTLNISANMTISYAGIELKDLSGNIAPNKILTAKEHFDDFIIEEYLRGDRFIIE